MSVQQSMRAPFRMSRASYLRIRDLGFDPSSLPHERVEACDLCNHHGFEVIADIDRYGYPTRFTLCHNCGLVFLNPRPTAEGYGQFYLRHYRPLIHALTGVPHGPEDLLANQRVYADRVASFLSATGILRDGMEAVDLGGSTGIVAQRLVKEGVRCLVVDPAEDELAVARKAGLETQLGSAEAWEAGPRRFDLALLCRTVDHLSSIRVTLQRVHDALRPGGLLFADIIDFETLARVIPDYRGALKIDHCFYLSDRTFRGYCSAVGFDILHTDCTGRNLAYVCRRGQPLGAPYADVAHAREMSSMLRQRMRAPRPGDPPVDLLTRLARRVKHLGRSPANDWVYV